MKLEIKNINLLSVVFSVYPLVLFVLSFLNAIFAIGDLSDYTFVQKIMQLVLWTLAQTLSLVVISLALAFVYNLLCSFGMKGIRFEIEEVENASAASAEDNSAF